VAVNIRLAEPGDAEALADLRSRLLEYMSGRRLTGPERLCLEEYFRSWDFRDPLCLVCEEDGKVRGCVAASFYRLFPGLKNPSGEQAVIHNLVVEEGYRGRGLGTALVDAILEECRARGAMRISLYATEMGRPVYERFGFKREQNTFPEMRLYIRRPS